ncbi:hypothetical protein HELRODRAFT_178110 [Helobdella robusta]|uniref:Uncharacterized protein n=1 Tax=Helobdella robusta TaxID=6412 RepID=T1FCR4_HELRO|nr:hypothetical protein HELRODRAFT_178110 [Helobdella robusta]ESN97324.1 hypothetical protein HELRODRAFT_178110 [Helobdella robusta]
MQAASIASGKLQKLLSPETTKTPTTATAAATTATTRKLAFTSTITTATSKLEIQKVAEAEAKLAVNDERAEATKTTAKKAETKHVDHQNSGKKTIKKKIKKRSLEDDGQIPKLEGEVADVQVIVANKEATTFTSNVFLIL